MSDPGLPSSTCEDAGNRRRALNLVALTVGEPSAPDLWTLRRLAATRCQLHVVSARNARAVSARKRFRSLVSKYGLLATISRLIGSRVFAACDERRRHRQLDRLFDADELRKWWRQTGLEPIAVPQLNHAETQSAVAALQPDIIVRVSGGILKPAIFSLARRVTLNIHHGQAPLIRGMWSIPWGIVEGRREWIGATVHVIDAGIDTGKILWRGAPQIAPGDDEVRLFFRTHLEAVEAMAGVIERYGSGLEPTGWPVAEQEPSVYRSSPGVWTWLKYLRLGRGRRAPVILERAVQC